MDRHALYSVRGCGVKCDTYSHAHRLKRVHHAYMGANDSLDLCRP